MTAPRKQPELTPAESEYARLMGEEALGRQRELANKRFRCCGGLKPVHALGCKRARR